MVKTLKDRNVQALTFYLDIHRYVCFNAFLTCLVEKEESHYSSSFTTQLGSLWDYSPESFIASGLYPLFEYSFLALIFLMKKQRDLDLEQKSSSTITRAFHCTLFCLKVTLLALSRFNFVVEVDDDSIPIFGGAIQPESAHYTGFFSLLTCLTLVAFESAYYLYSNEQSSLCGFSRKTTVTTLRIYLVMIALFVILEVSWAIVMFVDSNTPLKGKFPQICEYAIFLLATWAPILYLSVNIIRGISGRKFIITFNHDDH